MTVLYESVPLRYVERQVDPTKPLFYDSETLGLYGEITLAQFKQEHWKEALVVEYPNFGKLQEFMLTQWVVCFNIAYDMGTLEIAPERMDDLYFACKSGMPTLDKHTLDNCAPKFYRGIQKKEMQKSFLKKREAHTNEQLHYGALDVYALEYLWNLDEVQNIIQNNLAYKVDIKNQRHAFSFQHNGMPVIAKTWEKVNKETEERRVRLQAELDAYVGKPLNVKSWKQKQEAFPELPYNDKGKQPTDASAFKKLYIENNNEGAKLVLDTTKARTELQDLEKYRESYIPTEDPVRIRTFFNVAGAITGRYTSKGGDRVGYTNIQNIGRHFKHIFGYEEGAGRQLVSADYGTAELIAGCAIFNVPSYRELILDGVDLHKAMGALMTNKSAEEVTKDERQAAKAVNFGYLFGMGAEKFMGYAYDTYGVKFTLEKAKEAKAIYYEAHPAIASYHRKMGKNIKKHNFTVTTAMGRIVKPNGYTDALNIPVQGSIGECTKMAQNFLFEDYPSLMKEVMMVDMIHDSIVNDSPDKYVEDIAEATKSSMLLAWKEISKSRLFHYHDLPMGVDIDIGRIWK